MITPHSFHIPVLGIGYTIDTPLKVSQYGIDSVISLVDDILLEKLRKMYCSKFEIPYQEISDKIDDFRAKRITSYLNLVNEIADKKFEDLKAATIEKGNELKKFFSMLPDTSSLKQEFSNASSKYFHFEDIKKWVNDNMSMGSIDVNIMTKIDKDNFKGGEKLPIEYNDAHAALRGFANSNLTSSIVLSAGMSPRLYSYLEKFEDFYPNALGEIKKKIALKVSDFRSALIQGKFLAKKGLWVSEFRVESGLNCGGHAFATEGHLLGPILNEFKENRESLTSTNFEILTKALVEKSRPVPTHQLPLKITAQGGVGTAEEHQFLIDHYGIDSVGWGSPFLLVPEATSIDDSTMDRLISAKENDLYLSNISPLGVPFNSLRGNTKDMEKLSLIQKGKPGSSCPKKYIVFGGDSGSNMCTASRRYQNKKIKDLLNEKLPMASFKAKFDNIVEKSCICVGLGTSALLANNLDTKVEGAGVSICPGPNMAYFNKIMSLKEITDHIYGRGNSISRSDRPNMFVKELSIYIDYLKTKIEDTKNTMSKKQTKHFQSFESNLKEGIVYYQQLFGNLKNKFTDTKDNILSDLEANLQALSHIKDKLR